MRTFKRSFQLASVVLACGLVATGCSTTDPLTGEEQMSKAGKGAVIGAVTGALAGAAVGKDTKGVLVGAASGAAAGGAVGYYMDKQEDKLRQELADTGVTVTRDGDNILLNMPGNITFMTASSDIQTDFYDVLEAVATVLGEFQETRVEIAGHTDAVGSDESNMMLSQQRASAVAIYLQQQGVSLQRIDAIGLGESQPVAANDTDNGRAQNRRVEITLVPNQDNIR